MLMPKFENNNVIIIYVTRDAKKKKKAQGVKCKIHKNLRGIGEKKYFF